MTAKWKEVSAYTGQPVEEDAPTNAVAHGQVALPPDALMKKKKKKQTRRRKSKQKKKRKPKQTKKYKRLR